MNLKEIEEKIMKIVGVRSKTKNFESTPELSFIHFIEEVGEIARQLANKKIRPEKYDKENLKEEIADSFLELVIFANLNNINLDEIISKKLDELDKRDW